MSVASSLVAMALQDTAPYEGGGAAGGILGLVFFVIWLAIAVFFIAIGWKIFTKAGKPGWASLIPFYNVWVLVEICGKPPVWFIIGLIFFPILMFPLAAKFGKGAGFAIGLILLYPIFGAILAFGSARYQA